MTSLEWNEWLNDMQIVHGEEEYLSNLVHTGVNLMPHASKIRTLQKRIAKLNRHFYNLKPQTTEFTVYVLNM